MVERKRNITVTARTIIFGRVREGKPPKYMHRYGHPINKEAVQVIPRRLAVVFGWAGGG